MLYDRKQKISDKVSIVTELGIGVHEHNWLGLMDNNTNKIFAPMGNTDIEISNDKKAFICRYGKQPCTIYNEDGKLLAAQIPEAKFVDKNTENTFIILKDNDKYGLMDVNGNLVLKCEYEDMKDLGNGFVTCKKHGKYALFDRNAKQVSNFDFDSCYDAKDNLIYCRINNKYGVINENMQVVIPFKYDYIENFNEKGVAVARKKDLYGCINLKNQIVTDFQYANMHTSYDGYIRTANFVIENGRKTCKQGIIDKDGRKITECIYDDICFIDRYAKKYFPVKIYGKYGYVDLDGKRYFGVDAINAQYDIEHASIKGYKEKYYKRELKKLNRAKNKEIAVYKWQHRKDKSDEEFEAKSFGE